MTQRGKQRGNKRERIFFEEGDQQVYLDLVAEQLAKHEIAFWSYCLMPNHVHFILVPTTPDTLDSPHPLPPAIVIGPSNR